MKVKLRSGHCPLRAIIITGGIGASILFGVVGVALRLQLFGDGSIFCYAVAAQGTMSPAVYSPIFLFTHRPRPSWQ
jgi:hypothetical protein